MICRMCKEAGALPFEESKQKKKLHKQCDGKCDCQHRVKERKQLVVP